MPTVSLLPRSRHPRVRISQLGSHRGGGRGNRTKGVRVQGSLSTRGSPFPSVASQDVPVAVGAREADVFVDDLETFGRQPPSDAIRRRVVVIPAAAPGVLAVNDR